MTMIIGLDNVDIDTKEKVVYLGHYVNNDDKYVAAVNAKVDVVITDSTDRATYFKENGIHALIQT